VLNSGKDSCKYKGVTNKNQRPLPKENILRYLHVVDSVVITLANYRHSLLHSPTILFLVIFLLLHFLLV
jgi:hypothetical protein